MPTNKLTHKYLVFSLEVIAQILKIKLGHLNITEI